MRICRWSYFPVCETQTIEKNKQKNNKKNPNMYKEKSVETNLYHKRNVTKREKQRQRQELIQWH